MDEVRPEIERPQWSLSVLNESVRTWRAAFMDLPESHRPLFLRLTGCAPPAVLGESVGSQLSFRRLQDMFEQARTAKKLYALIDAAEQVTAELVGEPNGEQGDEPAGESGSSSPESRPALSRRFSRTWDEASLRAWCDRLEMLCEPHGIVPRLRVYG